MNNSSVFVVLLLLVMLIGVTGIVINRVVTKKGIGLRVTQFATVVTLVPTIAILAILKLIDAQVTQVLLGGIAGYVLSGLAGKISSANDGST